MQMTDTRDIAIKTATKLEAIETTIAGLSTKIDALHADLNERKGAERLARTIHTLLGGAAGAAVIKGISWLGFVPK